MPEESNNKSDVNDALWDSSVDELQPLLAEGGWHCLHLFYRINFLEWESFDREQKMYYKTSLTDLVKNIRGQKDVQLSAFVVISPKADLGFMLFAPDLQQVSEFEKRLNRALGDEILIPTYHYLSLSERSEYELDPEEYADRVVAERGLSKGESDFELARREIIERLLKYRKMRAYPHIPESPIVCFYPMSKRREVGANWFELSFEDRKHLMNGHAKLGRKWAGKIKQIITSSTGVDDEEWAVTLFANNLSDIKNIVYEMRFDKVSSTYAEFGTFIIGIQMPLNKIFQRLEL